LYHSGKDGHAKDLKRAFELYTQAANHSFVGAYFNLGCMYRDGDGVPCDYAKALSLYQKAADLEQHTGAMCALGGESPPRGNLSFRS